MSDEIKIVITLKGQTALVGVQKPDCDPAFSKIDGDLAAALKSVPKLVEEAKKGWETNPHYPKCETPLTPPVPPATTTSRGSTKSQAKPQAQPAMF